MKRRQQGVALIMVIMVVAVITIAVAELVSRQQVDIRRAGNLFDQDRAYLLALAGEDVARGWLVRDIEQNTVDNLNEVEVSRIPRTPFEGGFISGWAEDMQGRFNLNNLLAADGSVDPLARKRFGRLLRLVGLDLSAVDAVIDWMDKNSDELPDGAEDSYYSGQGYSAANRLFTSPSELALVKGIGFKGYQALAPYVSALPERTAINVNTAPDLVLAALVEGFSKEDGEELVQARDPEPPNEGFSSLDDFIVLSKLAGTDIVETDLDIASSYFLVTVNTEWGRARAQLYSLLKRDAAKKTVVSVMRGQGAY
ncbi:MAG TPA: general secretion pathway protein GspK [Candidatus Tenderia sp.]|nr:general secretion pathway protein GspK [Candidatus Tenderia sp.]